jgi:toxin-antitoxin system PIN domain toxin
MTCIADANVLFPLLVDGHVAHKTARRWWEKRSDDSVGLCLLTRMAVLRLLTNRVAMNGAPTTPEVALNAWVVLAVDPRSVFVDVAPPSHEKFFSSMVAGRQPTPNLWTDAWLAALARSLDHELVTFDRGFKSFDGIKLNLLSLEGQQTAAP